MQEYNQRSENREGLVMRRALVFTVAFVLTWALFIHAAEEDAEYRHDVMEAIGGHFGAIIKIVRGEVPHRDHLSAHVDALAGLANLANDLFPDDSQGGEALPKIWEEPEEFAKKVSAFKEAANTLKSALDAGDMDAFRGTIRNVGGACKGCHDDYRE